MISISKTTVFVFLLIIMGLTQAKAQIYEISLLTCDPGKELYSSFGHSAIRMREIGSEGQDLVFNFGTFDFRTPNFYGKFATGKLDYMLSVSTYADFIREYDYYRRDVREQILALNSEQMDFLIQHLWAQYDPARRYYRYDFFFNNCATKIRDAFEISLGNQLVWNDPPKSEEKTFRNLIDEYVYPLPWADLGIDLALGSVIDRNATEREKQFLPDYMEAAFANASIEGDGPTRPLVKESRVILEYPDEEFKMDFLNPYFIFWVIAILFTAITFYGHRKKRLFLGLDLGLFSILGILGLVVTFLWLFTDHSATKWNWNILWVFPGHLVLVWGLMKKALQPWVRKYLLFALIMADAAVVFWILGWQSFHPSLIPILLVIILRTNYLYYNLGSKTLKST
ncbi:DUF4105 domain-containing protein [Algoriphagus sp.]|jgi:hypothetical protein|uniref:lipoprotein N-acyltransferase Lnb domain-containing protein n=1 Tax=Algoriphagus sp. TaxID=1872435 RepID=UPI00272304A4|nr:DUF4105 domain-containing protein [Algoriphagus sp.]MDO8968418.1 DUF4105 domain-containing protein [Algoriphagus sp.]MDP3200420.1 DUF4105 domain-containing protein [Algoriphagus sp.]